jgi:hypothetical protein
LEDFKKVTINKKAAVKIAIIKAIDDSRIDHPYRPPYEPINYPPPTPVQNTSFHYGTDNYYGPSPSTSSASQNRSNVHHTPQTFLLKHRLIPDFVMLATQKV